jgi:hypothetical protein
MGEVTLVLLPFLRHLFWIDIIRHIAAPGPTLRMFTFRVFRPMGTQRIERVPFMIFAGGIYELAGRDNLSHAPAHWRQST